MLHAACTLCSTWACLPERLLIQANLCPDLSWALFIFSPGRSFRADQGLIERAGWLSNHSILNSGVRKGHLLSWSALKLAPQNPLVRTKTTRPVVREVMWRRQMYPLTLGDLPRMPSHYTTLYTVQYILVFSEFGYNLGGEMCGTHCPKSSQKCPRYNTKYRGKRKTTWNIPRSFPFPCCISCYISENRLIFGQCTTQTIV